MGPWPGKLFRDASSWLHSDLTNEKLWGRARQFRLAGLPGDSDASAALRISDQAHEPDLEKDDSESQWKEKLRKQADLNNTGHGGKRQECGV